MSKHKLTLRFSGSCQTTPSTSCNLPELQNPKLRALHSDSRICSTWQLDKKKVINDPQVRDPCMSQLRSGSVALDSKLEAPNPKLSNPKSQTLKLTREPKP